MTFYDNQQQEIGAIKAFQAMANRIKDDPDMKSVGVMSAPALIQILEDEIRDAIVKHPGSLN